MAGMPAILGGDPIVTEQPSWPESGPLEKALLAEIVDSGHWTGFYFEPATWRSVLEQVVSSTKGYGYGIGQPNGTLAIASGLRAQAMHRRGRLASGRTEVLVADLTHASAHYGVLLGLSTQLGFTPRLVPIGARRDATMDPDIVEDYIRRNPDQILAIVPATMYGNFGELDRFVELATEYDLLIHHDDALGGAARWDGRRAVTASVSGQSAGKAATAGEAGLTLADDPAIAWLIRADTDSGHGPSRIDPIPFAERAFIAAGNQRLAEQPAGMFLMGWLRALYARLQMRENRRQIQELILDPELFARPVLWNPEKDAEYPPFFSLFLSCTEALEQDLGLTPRDLRATIAAEGMWSEPGFRPTHQDPMWRHHTQGLDLGYGTSAEVYDRALFIHTKFVRHPEFVQWMRRILERVVEYAAQLRGVGDTVPEIRFS